MKCLVWIQQGFCEELSTRSGINNWTCTCAASYQGNQSYIKSNCSTSCDCSPEASGQSRGTWTCSCSSDGLPKVAAGSQDTTCFTACNCTSGSLTDAQATRKHISSTIVVVILLWHLQFRKLKSVFDSPTNPLSGYFRKASFSCRSKTKIIHGTLICFAYSELEHATNKFSHSNLIGLGGSSYVYRGQLKDGTTVAVKRLKAQGGPDADLLFFNRG
ncbi:RECEPTOR-LIKE SERINE/THREONINE-PROTEIN KINASE NCRK ISOFORM X1 [Salix purpurea]|uniref:RECEPTOR-LIKE SERINE/THREONINE-PROTEIN KINASE NCRK ISOFORM X1 n=1 Tax=Salix purpurea TaxID=77065 RepID=A0A9Q0WDY8_SALPP|nr:RECEPTOR-LIKE SERINE/THREONINE-PROTEIN KINASE NCRK ISOFORM X1 [Salix purpurea]